MLDFAVTRQSEPSAEVGAVAPSRLSLTFSCDGGGRTYLDRQFASYPFHVCRPHYFPHDAPGMATLYLQFSAGGLYQEDAHDIEIAANEGACAHVTTQASTIVHSMERGGATLRTTIAVGPGCHVEAVPDALILFPDARLTTGLTVRVHESATAIVGESFLMHDPDASDPNTDIGSFAAYKANTVLRIGTAHALPPIASAFPGAMSSRRRPASRVEPGRRACSWSSSAAKICRSLSRVCAPNSPSETTFSREYPKCPTVPAPGCGCSHPMALRSVPGRSPPGPRPANPSPACAPCPAGSNPRTVQDLLGPHDSARAHTR